MVRRVREGRSLWGHAPSQFVASILHLVIFTYLKENKEL